MKRNYYFTEAVKKEKQNLIDCVEETKNRIQLLKSIKRVYKKDWSNFQNFLKNFTSDLPNFDIYYSYSDIKIRSYPTEAYIRRYRIKDYWKDPYFEKIEKEDPRRIIRSYWLMDKIEYTIDEIMENIKIQIEKEEKYLKENETELQNYDKNVEKLQEKLEDLEKFFIPLGDWYYKMKTIAKEFLQWYTQ